MFGSVVLQNGIVLPASSSTQDVTVRREMCSVSVSHSKVLLFLVVDRQRKYGLYLSTKYVRN